jgi:hypothetical protein
MHMHQTRAKQSVRRLPPDLHHQFITNTVRRLPWVAGLCVAGWMALPQAVAGPVETVELREPLVSLPATLIERIDQEEWADVFILLDEWTSTDRSRADMGPPLATLRGAKYDTRMRERRQNLDRIKERALQRIAEPGRF